MTKLSENLSTIKSATDRIRVATDTQNDSIGDVATAVENLVGGGADLSDYFYSEIGPEQDGIPGYVFLVKKVPDDITVDSDYLSLDRAFKGFKGTTIPLINTASIMVMEGMFEGCSNLTTIPLLNTQSVTNMSQMFQECSSLEHLPACNVSNVVYMNDIFLGCDNLSIDDILQWCTRAVNCEEKNLEYCGVDVDTYGEENIQASDYYSAFVTAGWTIRA